MTNRPVEWDSEAYDRLSDPQFGWGMKLLETIDLHGDEVVLDAGCGSGRLTEELLKRVPSGRVIALDSSSNMIETARKRLAHWGDRVAYVVADLADFTLGTQLDLIFSNAVFHWVEDHDALFRSLFRALRPGGRLVAQFGGAGNLALLKSRLNELRTREPFATYLQGPVDETIYPTSQKTAARMRAAGFANIEATTHDAPVRFNTAEEFAAFVKTVNAHRYVAQLPEQLEQQFVDYLTERAAADHPPLTMDYVRLTVRGSRPALSPTDSEIHSR